ncbi:MAG TPA: hypothetical protein VMK16_13470 [Acidimicrobiales bacterium]|nr:hypothetical protein [Acidimicrobiales bacterium]
MSRWLRSAALSALLGTVAAVILAPQSALGLFTSSRTVGANAFSTSTLASPTGLGASGSGNAIALTWTATTSTFASGYDILRSTTSGGPYSVVGQVTPRTTITYTDSAVTAGTTYFYVIRATYQSWTSANTAEVSATPACSPSVVQSATGGGTANAVSTTFATTPGVGRLLVAVAATRNAGSLTAPSGWSTAVTQTGTGAPSQAIFYKTAGSSEPTTVTVAIGASGNANAIHLYELSCLSAVHATGSANGSSAAVSSGTVTTTQANTFLFAALVTRNGNSFVSWSGGFVPANDFTQGSGGSLTVFGAATRVAATAGSYSTTGTSSASGIWRGEIVAFI